MQTRFAIDGRRRLGHAIRAGALSCLLMAAGPDATASARLHLSGTIDIDQTRVAFLVSANGGGGTLHFRGRDYPFSIGGLGVGGIGVSKLRAAGRVYDLTDRARFAGVYSELRTGYALGDKGHGKLWLKNGDGVVLELEGKGEGIGLSLGADAVKISFR